MAALKAVTLAGQHRIISNKGGDPYSHENYLADAVSTWRGTLHLRAEFRLRWGPGLT